MRWRRSGGRKVRTPLYLQFEATECAADVADTAQEYGLRLTGP